MRETKTSEVRNFKKMMIIVVILYLASAILGVGNSFTGDEIIKIGQILIYEEIYGTIADEDWEEISELNIEKRTLRDGKIVISNSFKGKLLFENVDRYSKTIGYPIEYKPNILERLIIDIIYLFIFFAIGIFLLSLNEWSRAIIDEMSEIDPDDSLYDEEYYDDENDETLLEDERENLNPSEENMEITSEVEKEKTEEVPK